MKTNCIYPADALILAPLSGFTDLPYRRAARACGCRYAFTEMVDAASLAYSPDRAAELLRRGEEEDFLATQLVGSDPELIKRACGELEKYNFDLLDLNLGCPVPKVAKKGAGAMLGRNAEQAVKCFSTMVRYSPFPLTVKLRIVDDRSPDQTVALVKELASLGAKAATIHGRTSEGFYTGTMHPDFIAAVAEAVDIPVIANGGVKDLNSYESLKRDSGCSRIMLAQGAMGNPWLFRQLDGTGRAPTFTEWLTTVRHHIAGMVEIYGEYSALRQARKIVHDYMKGRGFPTAFRAEASAISTMAELDWLLSRARPAPGTSATAPRPFTEE